MRAATRVALCLFISREQKAQTGREGESGVGRAREEARELTNER